MSDGWTFIIRLGKCETNSGESTRINPARTTICARAPSRHSSRLLSRIRADPSPRKRRSPKGSPPPPRAQARKRRACSISRGRSVPTLLSRFSRRRSAPEDSCRRLTSSTAIFILFAHFIVILSSLSAISPITYASSPALRSISSASSTSSAWTARLIPTPIL